LQGSPKFDILATILNNIQPPGCISIASFRPNWPNWPFNYRSRLWLFLSNIVLSQTCPRQGNDSTADSEVDSRLEKDNF